MDREIFRVIPGYENYGTDIYGNIVSFEREIILTQYELNGYVTVDTHRGSLTGTLPVHRAVALAWVINNNPFVFNVVNHLDGNPFNNFHDNLEWTNYSGNNFHAVNNGLRRDNIRCKLRNFYTGEVHWFNSISQAAVFAGLSKDVRVDKLNLKMFGALANNTYEFRYADDTTPWFYENRSELIPVSRYMVIVTDLNGVSKEVYSNKTLLKEYQLYDCPGRSINELVNHANKTFSDKVFTVRDSYNEERFKIERDTEPSIRRPVRATRNGQTMLFDSLSKAAEYFKVDRSTIQNRIGVNKHLDEWIFT